MKVSEQSNKKFMFFVSNTNNFFVSSHQVFILFALIAVAVAESANKVESEPAPAEAVVESEPAEVEAVTEYESVPVEVEYVRKFEFDKIVELWDKMFNISGPSAIQLRL